MCLVRARFIFIVQNELRSARETPEPIQCAPSPRIVARTIKHQITGVSLVDHRKPRLHSSIEQIRHNGHQDDVVLHLYRSFSTTRGMEFLDRAIRITTNVTETSLYHGCNTHFKYPTAVSAPYHIIAAKSPLLTQRRDYASRLNDQQS